MQRSRLVSRVTSLSSSDRCSFPCRFRYAERAGGISGSDHREDERSLRDFPYRGEKVTADRYIQALRAAVTRRQVRQAAARAAHDQGSCYAFVALDGTLIPAPWVVTDPHSIPASTASTGSFGLALDS